MSNKKEIKGTVGNRGIYRGRARVLRSVDEFHKFKSGDVLITEAATPIWTPLLHIAGAVVTDLGGKLCHAAIVSREMDIPCVVGTENATDNIPDGSHVEVDGSRGVVVIVD